MRIGLCLVLSIMAACGEIDNSTSESRAKARTKDDKVETQSQDKAGAASTNLDISDLYRAEGQPLPLLRCLGHVVRKAKPDKTIMEFRAFAEHETGKLVVLPGFRQDESEGMYVTSTYSYQELREKCYRGLKAYFQLLVQSQARIFPQGSEGLPENYEVSPHPSMITSFVLMPNKQTFEVASSVEGTP